VRVVHFGKFYPPDSGGIENVTESLAEGAAMAGMSVSVVCFDREGRLSRDEVRNSVHVVRSRIALQAASQPLGVGYVHSAIRAARSAGVVHVHVPNPLAAFMVAFIGRQSRVVVHWHSDIVNKGVLGQVVKPLERLMLNRADAIICTSQAYAASSTALKDFRHKVSVVPIGIRDTAATRPGDMALPPRLEAALLGKRIVLSVGRLVAYKGFDVLIEAARGFPDDVVTLIVGGGPLLEDLRTKIRARGLDSNVIVTGHVLSDVLDSLFRRATVFCLPSVARSEAFGVVLVEAMSYGLPIVATEIEGSAVPWVNVHETTGLNVAVQDPAAMARACLSIIDDPELRNRFAVAARQRYLSHFTERQSIDAVLAVYQPVTNECRKPVLRETFVQRRPGE
jgi:glycosyltransferase involved in cell wall biosynthesis